MNRFFTDSEIIDNKLKIENEDAHHIKDVLRLKENDRIICVKNKKEFLCNIDKFEKNSIILRVEEKLTADYAEEIINITLMQGLPKGDKLEFIIEKAVEAGAERIIPLKLTRSIAKISEKDTGKKLMRFRKIAKSAAQQSHSLFIPEIEEPKTIKQIDFSIYDLKIVCYEDEKKTSLKQVLGEYKAPKKIAVIIGPEGGLTPEEIEFLKEKDFISASLGKKILRCETAGLYAIASINYNYM